MRQHAIPHVVVIPALAAIMVIGALLLPVSAFGARVTPAKPSVMIDPGHGGVYPGAVYGGVREADLNLQMSRRLATELKRRNIGSSLVRHADVTMRPNGSIATWRWDSADEVYRYQNWGGSNSTSLLQRDLQQRVNIGNKSGADIFVSIHNNAAGNSAAVGAETYRAPNDPLSRQLARDVQTGVIARTGARDRGVFTASFYVIRWSNQPAVLVEAGFMSNPAELARLRDPAYQQRVAAGIADGLQTFFGRSVEESLTRYWGADRYDTAAALVRAGYSAADTVVLASGDIYADSLVATPLAAKHDAPIMVTPGSRLHPRTAAELRRLQPENLLVVGGTRSVSDSVMRAAASAAGLDPSDRSHVRRIAGRDRYATSLAVARELEAPAENGVVVASGRVFADALSVAASAASTGQPILLAPDSMLDPSIHEYIRNAGDQRPATVIGGTSVIPDQVMSDLTFTRIGGSDRYETNWRVFRGRYSEDQRLEPVFVSGTDFPDALVAGPWAAREGRPLVLIGGTALPNGFRPWYYANHPGVIDPVVIGGPASVSAYLEPILNKMKME